MPFEDFDNKLRQAAEQHHPNYDEQAWSKMNVLLDKHLPQKEDRRRRIIFFILLFLLLGGGATWLLIDKPWQPGTLVSNQQVSKDPTSVKLPSNSTDASQQPEDVKPGENKQEAITTPSSATPEDRPVAGAPTNGNAASAKNSTLDITAGGGNISSGTPVVTDAGKQSKNLTVKNKKQNNNDNQFQLDVQQANIGKGKQEPGATPSTGQEKQTIPSPLDKKNQLPVATNTGGETPATTGDNKNTQPVSASIDPGVNTTDLTVKSKPNSSLKDSSNTTEQTKTNEEKKVAKKEKNKKPNLLSFSLSAGPDVSSVGMDHPGKVRLLTGAGIGYTFRDRLTIRTGFYSASKVYVAQPNDYNPKETINRLYLTNISANCKVYEIPLSLSYNFGKSEKYKIFTSAGISSFIMKKEVYDYLYEYPSVPNPTSWHYYHTVNNKNKHYFSVLSLSAGYQRKINRFLSYTAEPYFKLPMAGVGFGRIKLNSFGLMFSVNVTPFAPKK